VHLGEKKKGGKLPALRESNETLSFPARKGFFFWGGEKRSFFPRALPSRKNDLFKKKGTPPFRRAGCCLLRESTVGGKEEISPNGKGRKNERKHVEIPSILAGKGKTIKNQEKATFWTSKAQETTKKKTDSRRPAVSEKGRLLF